MFSKLAFLAFVTPLISSLTLRVPPEVRSQTEFTITWDIANDDPELFTLELVNEDFNFAFAIANNVDIALGSVTLPFPNVPLRSGYTLRAVKVGDINDVYSETDVFTVLEPLSTLTPSSTSFSTGTTPGTATSASSPSGTGADSLMFGSGIAIAADVAFVL